LAEGMDRIPAHRDADLADHAGDADEEEKAATAAH